MKTICNHLSTHKLKYIFYPLPFIFVIIVWYNSYFIIRDKFDLGNIKTTEKLKNGEIKETEKDQGRGTFGDMFGAVNALFSGLAFAGLLLTLAIQIIDSNKQRQEFKEQFELSEKTHLMTIFLEMMRFHKENLNYLVTKESNEEYIGEEVLEKIFEKQKEEIKVFIEQRNDLKLQTMSSHLAYKDYEIIEIFATNQLRLKIYKYILDLLELLKFIGTNSKDKELFLSILKNQLSEYELFWFCIYSFDFGYYELTKKILESLKNKISDDLLGNLGTELKKKYKKLSFEEMLRLYGFSNNDREKIMDFTYVISDNEFLKSQINILKNLYIEKYEFSVDKEFIRILKKSIK